MSKKTDYSIGPNGILYIHTGKGGMRRANEREWLAIWRSDPRLTLRLAG